MEKKNDDGKGHYIVAAKVGDMIQVGDVEILILPRGGIASGKGVRLRFTASKETKIIRVKDRIPESLLK